MADITLQGRLPRLSAPKWQKRSRPSTGKHLAGEFGDHPALDHITVELTTNYAGEEVCQVAVVYEGTGYSIGSNKATKVLTALATPLEELGLPPVLLQGFVSKDEYPIPLEMRTEALSGEYEE